MKLAWDAKGKRDRAAGYQRERSHDLYHTARWTRVAAAYRAAHPLCKRCADAGIIKAAQHTDHIVPWPVCGTDGFFDTNNLQSLCADCNHKKGQEDKKVIQQWREIQQLQRR